jgi:hypothetical protein
MIQNVQKTQVNISIKLLMMMLTSSTSTFTYTSIAVSTTRGVLMYNGNIHLLKTYDHISRSIKANKTNEYS